MAICCGSPPCVGTDRRLPLKHLAAVHPRAWDYGVFLFHSLDVGSPVRGDYRLCGPDARRSVHPCVGTTTVDPTPCAFLVPCVGTMILRRFPTVHHSGGDYLLMFYIFLKVFGSHLAWDYQKRSTHRIKTVSPLRGDCRSVPCRRTRSGSPPIVGDYTERTGRYLNMYANEHQQSHSPPTQRAPRTVGWACSSQCQPCATDQEVQQAGLPGPPQVKRRRLVNGDAPTLSSSPS